MVHYKLCYFNLRGRGEAIRYILAQAGVDFEDNRIGPDEWAKLKPSLVPANHWLAAKADMLVDGVNDQYPNLRPFIVSVLKGEATQAEELWKAYKTENLPSFLTMYEKFLVENGGKYFVGDHVSLFVYKP